MRTGVSALLALLLPMPFARPLLNMLGHRVAHGASVGMSWIYCDFLGLDKEARIGHFNLVAVRRLILRERACLGRANMLKGPFNVLLKRGAAIGNRNRVMRAGTGVTYGPAQLWLGEMAKLTADHRIDCTQSVRMGAFSTLAGVGSQIWTHGYVHAMSGAGRYRIDGRVEIERNVYIGSACLLSMGVRLASGVIVGGGTSVSRSLLEPGLYVSGPVRELPRPEAPESRADLRRVADPTLCEAVFLKRYP
jgi:acetyltransferase-like isoleucine patch superfamily enzyme